MYNAFYPYTACCSAFNFALLSVRHIYDPFTIHAADIHSYVIQHLIFVAEKILIAKSIYTPNGNKLRRVGIIPVPRSCGSLIRIDRVPHTEYNSTVHWLGITTFSVSTLSLTVPCPIFSIK